MDVHFGRPNILGLAMSADSLKDTPSGSSNGSPNPGGIITDNNNDVTDLTAYGSSPQVSSLWRSATVKRVPLKKERPASVDDIVLPPTVSNER